jgi:hypothetical protein
MEVAVIKMRSLGVRLSPETLRSAVPLRGHMSITYWHLSNETENRRIRSLVLRGADADTAPAIACLNDALQTRLKGDSMVYVGREHIGDAEYPQAWWVRLRPAPEQGTRFGHLLVASAASEP